MTRTKFKTLMLGAAAICAGAAGPAPANSLAAVETKIRSEIRPWLTSVRQGDLFNSQMLTSPSQFTGVGGLFIQTAATGTGGFLCTGSLVSSNTVLTAAHCLDTGDLGPITSISFFLPDYVNAAGREVYSSTGYTINPNYEEILGGYDVGLVRLAGPVAAGHDIYELYTGSGELGVTHTKVGTGTIGTGADGTYYEPFDFDGEKRQGGNIYDFYWNNVLEELGFESENGFDAFGAPTESILVFDFDSGLSFDDVFGRYMNAPGLGLTDQFGRPFDINSSPGDSGGPTFVNGQIAGITSFGITGNIFEPGLCGEGNSVDQSFNLVDGNFEGCTNSSFGEISGDTRVASFLDYINGAIDGTVPFIGIGAAAVPEPSTWAFSILGFGLIGGSLRRRRAGATAIAA